MSGRRALDLQIEHEHCRAICDEIGNRLRQVLNREASKIPQRLLALIDQLAELEHEANAPSIVPSMEDIRVDQKRQAPRSRACHQLSQMIAAARWIAARKFLAVLS
jgi:hypothetical protein